MRRNTGGRDANPTHALPDKGGLLELQTETSDGIAVIKISGKLVFDESLLFLRREVRELLDEGLRLFVIDLTQVPYCDSSGSGEVIGAYSSITKAAGSLALAGLSDRIRALWTRVKILSVFDTFETATDAGAFLRDRRRDSEAET
jgi:anti-sigma B factor antagonist